MTNIYLQFYNESTRKIHESELPFIDNIKYLKYTKDHYYELRNNVFIGKIDKRSKFAFLLQKDNDIFLNPDVAKDVMDDDIVLIEIVKQKPKVALILKRGLEFIIVEAKKRKRGFKYFTEKPLNKNILVDNETNIIDGSILKLKVEQIKNDRIYTTIANYVGHVSDPNIDILKIVASFDWPDTNYDELEKAASELNIDIKQEALNRLNLTDDLIITIDGKTAKDLDDAISLTYDQDNYYLGVHIADVSLYVKPNSIIDQSAFQKATSAYLANSVIPMLPRKLANDLCSLNPHTKKLTLSILMTINKEGKVTDYRLEKTVIESKYRLNYDEVNSLLNNNVSLNNEKLDEMIIKMDELSQILTKNRQKRGSLNFVSEELEFDIDENNDVKKVKIRKTDVGEELIESFMLIANETVAFHMETNHFPSIYRVHEKPEESKLELTFNLLSNLGVKVSKSFQPKNLQKILKELKDTQLEHIGNMLLLRSMQKAYYSNVSLGHYGLAARYYTHFTSPIRRYPDLILHRIIRDLVFAENNSSKMYDYYEKHLEDISKHTSKMERTAIEMEREVEQLMACKYMVNKIGKTFTGQIVQVLKTGFFVKLTNGIEGFVNIKNNFDNYEYSEITLSYKINGQLYKIGDKITIQLDNVDMMLREIDFILL